VILLLNGDKEVRNRVGEVDGSFVPTVVLGELFFGAYKSGTVKKNIRRIQEFIAGAAVLVCDEPTADQYGQVKNLLRAKGRPIPENDVWIAALARQHGLTLATRDEHFSAVDGLILERW
jgi:tRNA(fMet)-specific endonuclease VapC